MTKLSPPMPWMQRMKGHVCSGMQPEYMGDGCAMGMPMPMGGAQLKP